MPQEARQLAAGERPRSGTILLLAGIGVVIWLIGDVLLLLFGSILLAIGLDGLAAILSARMRLPRGWAVAVVSLALTLALVVPAWLIVPELIAQMDQLWQRLRDFYDVVRESVLKYGWVRELLEADDGDRKPLQEVVGRAIGRVATATVTLLGIVGSLLILVVTAFFAVADPQLYRRGLLRLVPPARRPRVDETVSAVAHALRWWFLGQIVSMLVLGVTVSVGLLLIGVDLWLGLGVLTALLTFVPFLGPIIAGIPILIVGFAVSVETGLVVLVFYVIIQNIEGTVLTPVIQQKAVKLPPALLIAAQLVMSVLFGATGLILAAPLTAAAMVAVRKLYIEDVLEKETAAVKTG